MSAAVRSDDAVARLLEAWRGEVEAKAVYTILAGRIRDPRRAQVIREIADGEARHRERIEQRLRELGWPIPDPLTVRISFWLRLQARFAPVTRMLAHMESNEQVEITDRYKRSTGGVGWNQKFQGTAFRRHARGRNQNLESRKFTDRVRIAFSLR